MSLPNLLEDKTLASLERLPEIGSDNWKKINPHGEEMDRSYISPPTTVYRCANCGDTKADAPNKMYELEPCPSCLERVWIPT